MLYVLMNLCRELLLGNREESARWSNSWRLASTDTDHFYLFHVLYNLLLPVQYSIKSKEEISESHWVLAHPCRYLHYGEFVTRGNLLFLVKITGRQGVTQDLETGGQYRGFLKFRGSKVSYPINKNDHSSLMYWLGKTKCDSLCHLMYLLSSMSETFEILPWTQTNTEWYGWVSFSQKSCVWESKWLPGGWLGKSLLVGFPFVTILHILYSVVCGIYLFLLVVIIILVGIAIHSELHTTTCGYQSCIPILLTLYTVCNFPIAVMENHMYILSKYFVNQYPCNLHEIYLHRQTFAGVTFYKFSPAILGLFSVLCVIG